MRPDRRTVAVRRICTDAGTDQRLNQTGFGFAFRGLRLFFCRCVMESVALTDLLERKNRNQ